MKRSKWDWVQKWDDHLQKRAKWLKGGRRNTEKGEEARKKRERSMLKLVGSFKPSTD